MNKQKTAEYKQQLLTLREELRALVEGSQSDVEPVELDQPSIGRLSRMDAMQNQQMAQETLRRRKQQLLRVEGALKRIELDDFGYCALCDAEINPQRLDIDPTTTRCIECLDL